MLSMALILLQAGPAGPGMFRFFLQAGPMAKFILALLVLFSIGSWAIIFGKLVQFRRADRQSEKFLETFHRSQRFSEVNAQSSKLSASPLVGIFQAGYAEIDAQIKNAPDPERPGEKRAYRISSVPALERTLTRAVNVELQGVTRWLGFLATSTSYEMGVPAGRLGDLYRADLWEKSANVRVHLRAAADTLSSEGLVSDGQVYKADYYISALPFERAEIMGSSAPDFEHSPITGIHIWFDRSVTDLPHATLLDRTLQWMFNKDDGRYLQLVVSASRSLVRMDRNEILQLALTELAEFFPQVKSAQVERFHVVKEVRATFSANPGLMRPPTETENPNLFRAGDWVDSGWPATMEGAVRSGYLAAEAVTRASGSPLTFVVPDIG